MSWKKFVYQQIIEYCNRMGSRTFSLQELYADKEDIFRTFKPNNYHRMAKLRQQLQFLRDDGLITFLDNSGHYTLRGIELLETETREISTIDISRETPEKKEYLVEIYVRNVTWAKQAKEILGDLCLCNNCKNTFIRDDGTRYIEVHHIIPLCSGGEDGLWNLSVLCAHHHKMAHFSDINTRISMENLLLKEVRCRI